jgi:uncharacterized OsmC-like protein
MAKNVDEDYLLSGRSSNTGHRKTVVVYTISVSNRSCVNSPFPSLITKFEFYATLVIETDIQKAIQLSEQTFCPVWAMLKNNVVIKTTYSINL